MALITNDQVKKLTDEILSKNKGINPDLHFTCVMYDLNHGNATAAAVITKVTSSLHETVKTFLTLLRDSGCSFGKILASDHKRSEVYRNF